MVTGRHSSIAQAPRRGPRPAKVILVIVVILVVVAALAAVALFVLGSQNKGVEGEVLEGTEISIDIESGSTTTVIGELLAEKGVIASSSAFVDRVEELGQGNALRAGTYLFVGGQDIDSIIETIVSGDVASLTIPEGYTLTQIAERVSEETDISYDEFYNLAKTGAASYADAYPVLANAYEGSMEGFLFPATYEISKDMTADSLIREMLDAYTAQIASIDMSYAASKNLTEYDVVTLASMVEKESRMSGDKADIAAVFYNRLHEGITLGSDVTTYYAVGKDLTEELTAQDLASDSPYNTRNPNKYGLPAGPICSPGIEALEAAANPTQKSYLYFFWSASQQQTMFFDTQEQFDAAWAQYGN